MKLLLSVFTLLSVTFSHLSFMDGLSTGSVTDICFDEKGIVWIGTGNGLNSYDGNKIRNHPARSNSVMRLTCDKKGTLFVACRGEIYALDLRTMEYRAVSDDDSRAIFWYENSLYVCVDNLLKKYNSDEITRPDTIAVFGSSDKITALTISDGGTAWMGTENGDLIRYSIKDKGSLRFNLGSMVENVFLDSRGILWASTLANGLARVEQNKAPVFLRHCKDDEYSISSDFVRSVCEDDCGNLWVGTFAGLDLMDFSNGRFYHNFPDKSRPESLSNSSVWVVRKDAQGSIWAGTFFGGVNWFNPAFEAWTGYPDSGDEGTGLSSKLICSIGRDADGNVLVCTEGGGFNMVNPESFKSIWYGTNRKNRICADNVKDLLFDRKRNCIWLGTHLGGIDKIILSDDNPPAGGVRSGHTVHLPVKGDSGLNDVLCLADGGDSLFVGTTVGLYAVNKQDAAYREIFMFPDSGTGLAGIRDIHEGMNGDFWFSTESLFRYSSVSGKVDTFSVCKDIRGFCISRDDGTPVICRDKMILFLDSNAAVRASVDLSGNLEDNETLVSIAHSPYSGRYILSTSRGFCILEKNNSVRVHFLSGHGFSIYCPSSKALAVDNDGTVFVGGRSGLVSFNENEVDFPEVPYRLEFSRLYMDNTSSGVPISYSKSITIGPETSNFSVEFFSTNHIEANASGFEYRMAGLMKEWADTWDGNRIFFTRVPHGKYTLEVRPKDTDKSVCKGISIHVTILPPWYLTIWAKIVYILAALAIICFSIMRILAALKKREEARLASQAKNDKEKFRIFEKATSIVYGNLGNSEFGIKEFAIEMALSRSSLFEKIKTATGKTPNEFILDIRLKEAARFLKNNPEMNIGDVAFETGFSSAHYFSKCFKARYGDAPAVWLRKNL